MTDQATGSGPSIPPPNDGRPYLWDEITQSWGLFPGYDGPILTPEQVAQSNAVSPQAEVVPTITIKAVDL
jgi:hypothetical protein